MQRVDPHQTKVVLPQLCPHPTSLLNMTAPFLPLLSSAKINKTSALHIKTKIYLHHQIVQFAKAAVSFIYNVTWNH